MLTADTYVSVEPGLVRREAEAGARLIEDAGRDTPGTNQRRRSKRIAPTTPRQKKANFRPARFTHI